MGASAVRAGKPVAAGFAATLARAAGAGHTQPLHETGEGCHSQCHHSPLVPHRPVQTLVEINEFTYLFVIDILVIANY